MKAASVTLVVIAALVVTFFASGTANNGTQVLKSRSAAIEAAVQ